MSFKITHPYNALYVYSIDDEAHRGAYKIGKSTVIAKSAESLTPNCEELNQAAHKTIYSQTHRAAIAYKLEYTDVCFYRSEDGDENGFWDHDVHAYLEKMGKLKRVFPNVVGEPDEWYECTLDDIKFAIAGIKAGWTAPRPITQNKLINFRDEQRSAIEQTISRFEIGKRMLWNAKMRFGKTLCSLELIRQKQYKRTLIVTHRPAVRDGWFSDYTLIPFGDNFMYGSKNAEKPNPDKLAGEKFSVLEEKAKKTDLHYIYFASMQDLCGGEEVKKKAKAKTKSDKLAKGYKKNTDILDETPWDLIIIDEAHEGTQTDIGQIVLESLQAHNPDFLYLSGTPYNILNQFKDGEIYTWDYNMEQAAKANWTANHPNEENPYEELPEMGIRTYKLSDSFSQYYQCDNDYFNFAEFFRTWIGDEKKDGCEMPSDVEVGDFVHEADMRRFLDMMHEEGTEYPYANEDYRNLFKHTFWLVPGVKEAAALSKLLREPDSYWAKNGYFPINVAGEGDDPDEDDDINSVKGNEKREKREKDALAKVKKAINEHQRTITISCGRLTTGVTVKPWTGVFMLKGNGDTKAATYMQTIFRAQSPCREPYLKTVCYAFDFAPDRTLTVIDEYLESQPNNKGKSTQTIITEFLKYCSVETIDGTTTQPLNTNMFITQVNQAYSDFVIKHGFKGRQLYADLNELSPQMQTLLDEIDASIKKSSSADKSNGKTKVVETGTVKTGTRKHKESKKDTTVTNAQKEKRKKREKYQAILDTMSSRIPMMVFGGLDDIDESTFSLVDFVDSITAESWEVFMPKGLEKTMFKQIISLYRMNVLMVSIKEVLDRTKKADTLPVTQRVLEIADMLSTFRFPDKETVLTPWNVVNMHMTSTIGGYDFYDEVHVNRLFEPRLVYQGDITQEVLADKDTHVLEINSKSGVYPLWLAYSIFRYRCDAEGASSDERQHEIWKEVVENNIFVLCMSPMAVAITKRVLSGFMSYQTRCVYEKDLIEQLKDDNKKAKLIKKLQTYKYWDMQQSVNKNQIEFSTVVGNPPYQGNSSAQLYPHFYLASIELGKSASLIFPTGWQKPCAPTAKGLARMNKEEIKADSQIVEINVLHNVFPGVSGAAEVNTVFWKKGYDNGLSGEQRILTDGLNPQNIQLQWEQANADKPLEIIQMAGLVKKTEGFVSMQTEVSSRTPFGLESDAFTDVVKYGLVPIVDESPRHKTDIKIYGGLGRSGKAIRYIPRNYALPKKPKTFDHYKVLVPCAWGNMSNAGLGGSFGDIIVAKPYEICTKTYTTSGCFDDIVTARKHAKYLMTKFVRALLFLNKFGIQASHTAFAAVPVQDYTEPWWNKSIAEIDEELFNKYEIPENTREFVRKNIQTRDESSIVNL